MARVPPVNLPGPEVHSSDMAITQPAPVSLDGDAVFNREPEEIALVDTPVNDDYLERLAFAEELVTIRLDRTQEKFQAPGHIFRVNNIPIFVPVGKPATIKRKYLEVIARSQPFHVTTDVGNAMEENPHNRAVRTQSSRFPFSVIRDPNPRGYEWLQRVMAES